MGFGQGADGLNVIGQAQADEEAVSYAVGMLLKGSGDGVFYVTEDGSRLHIYDWDSYLQYGFSPTDIVEIDDATQDTIPLVGKMTRLISTPWGHLYWMQNGMGRDFW